MAGRSELVNYPISSKGAKLQNRRFWPFLPVDSMVTSMPDSVSTKPSTRRHEEVARGNCKRVRERLAFMDYEEKRLGLEALDVSTTLSGYKRRN